jgi:hypothetical protein
MSDTAQTSSKRWKDDDEAAVISFRHVLTSAEGKQLSKDELIRHVSKELGYIRVGRVTDKYLRGRLIAAARRRILYTERGICYLDCNSIQDYPRDLLKTLFLTAMGSVWWDGSEAYEVASRYLGYSRTGSAIRASFDSIVNGLIRQKLLERDREFIRKTSLGGEPTYRQQPITYTRILSLKGKRVSFTGRLPGLVREDAIRKLKKHGGVPAYGAITETDILVVGDDSANWKFTDAGWKIANAQRLNRQGKANVEFIKKDQFFALIKF